MACKWLSLKRLERTPFIRQVSASAGDEKMEENQIICSSIIDELSASARVNSWPLELSLIELELSRQSAKVNTADVQRC